ncbi:MAG: photosynthesis system II assembly factor Ycf48 [Oscillatoriaceae cyanobacterium]
MKHYWQKVVALLGVVFLCVGCNYLPATSYNPWKVIQLPADVSVFDIAFTDDDQHGWLVGSKATLLETTDGGESWKQKQIEVDAETYRFNSVSFVGKEGWIVGTPPILLHSEDEGNSWSRIPLDEKLPGSPLEIVALGQKTAEMLTDVGAIYRTTDGAQTWKALVAEALGVIRNMDRSPDGKYVAVSSKGNFYSTWEPGQKAWVPHNRTSSRRLQNIGFGQDGRLWLIARGGQVQFTEPEDLETWAEPISPEFSTSWGFLDLAYRTPEEIWVTGGSGNLLSSFDGGKTWQKDREVENVPSNFDQIVFFGQDRGFIMGQRGIILKYNPPGAAA